MKKLRIILLGLLISTSLYGQYDAANIGYELTRLSDNVQFANSFELDSISGFASGKYLNDKWTMGICRVSDTLQLEAFYNIDLYNDKLVYTVHLDSASRTSSHPYTFKEVLLNKKKFQYLDYKDGITSGKGFFEVLLEGNTKVLERTEIIFVQATPSDAYRDFIPAHFDKANSYFIKKKNEPAFEISTNKKSILAALSNKSAEIEQFMTLNKEKGKNIESLIKIIEYYNKISVN